MKTQKKMCDCCSTKKAVKKNANGQWCCKNCDIIATVANKALSDLVRYTESKK